MTKDPVNLTHDSTVFEAAQQMQTNDIGNVLVTKDGELLGILTDRDIVVRVVAEGGDPKQVAVGECCSTELEVLAPDDPLDVAIKLMRDRGIRRIPVVEGDNPVGILSLGDLALEKDPGSVLAGISQKPPNE